MFLMIIWSQCELSALNAFTTPLENSFMNRAQRQFETHSIPSTIFPSRKFGFTPKTMQFDSSEQEALYRTRREMTLMALWVFFY